MKTPRNQTFFAMTLAIGMATTVSTLMSTPARADAPIVNLSPTTSSQQMVAAGAPGPSAMAQMRRNQMSLLAKLQFLQKEIQDLRGRQEVQQHDIAMMQQRQLSLYKDLDQRLAKLGANGGVASQQAVSSMQQDAQALQQQSQTFAALDVNASIANAGAANRVANNTTPTAPVPATHSQSSPTQQVTVQATPPTANKAAAASPAVNTASASKSSATIQTANANKERAAYHQAYQLINQRQYSNAVASMQAFLSQYPNSQYTPNAHYWLGELYLIQGLNDKALGEFATVVKQYPGSPKTSDAMLKVGYIYFDQKDWTQARAELNKVIATYPNTTSAQLATARLQQIKRSGN